MSPVCGRFFCPGNAEHPRGPAAGALPPWPGSRFGAIGLLFIYLSFNLYPNTFAPLCCRGKLAETVNKTATRCVNKLLLKEQYPRLPNTESVAQQQIKMKGSKVCAPAYPNTVDIHEPSLKASVFPPQVAKISSLNVCDMASCPQHRHSVANELQRRGTNLQP